MYFSILSPKRQEDFLSIWICRSYPAPGWGYHTKGSTGVKENTFSKRDSLAVKGAAILLMLCLHCFRIPELYAGFPVNFAPFPEDLVNRICTYGKVCVGIFAFISGYGWQKPTGTYLTGTSPGPVSAAITSPSGLSGPFTFSVFWLVWSSTGGPCSCIAPAAWAAAPSTFF